MKLKRRLLPLLMALALMGNLMPTAFAATTAAATSGETTIVLSDSGTKVNGAAISNAPSAAVYQGAEIIYYQSGQDSSYGASTNSAEQHTAAEAAKQTVITITKPGTYRVSGTLSAGQLAIDLGSDAASDPTAVVTLILDNVNITCAIAPAVIFYRVYECSSSDTATATSAVDTSAAGANVIIADGSTNTVTGSHVAKIYQSGTTSKKYKYDGAFYSVMSMNVTSESKGTGVLNIIADNEGLDAELHLTVNGGNINIYAQNDGINTNEDGVSVTTINGGTLHICAGLGAEGDGVDSNGWLVINGGTVIATANPNSDSGLDSDKGSYINGGTVVALGSTMDWAESDSDQVTMNLQFASAQSQDEAIVVTDQKGTVVFAYDPDQDEVTGSNLRKYQGAVLSCEKLAVGETYYVYLGGVLSGTETMGIYDVATVTGYSGGVRQMYTGTDVGGLFGGMGGMGGGMRPDNNGTQTPPELPDGATPGERPNREDHFGDGTMIPTEKGDAITPPVGGEMMPTTDTTATASVYFYLSDKVNAFSGVCDETQQTYQDVAVSAWYAGAVNYVSTQGLMTGTSATVFSPNMTLTRATMATVLYRLAGSPAINTAADFPDVSAGQWYSDAIAWASAEGVVEGYDNGAFGPNDVLTRQQMATMLYRYAAVAGHDTTLTGNLDAYDDAGSISSYAKTAMQWAVGSGLITGTGASELSPTATATRAQAATILMNLSEKFGNKE